MPDLLLALQSHLITVGVARDPDTTGSSLPPLWLEPREGTPAPGEGDVALEQGVDTVIAAYRSGQIPPADGEGYSERWTVDFRIRTVLPSYVTAVHERLLAEFAPPIYGYRSDWVMGGLGVIASRQWRGLAPLGSDELGFNFNVSYLFEILVS